MIDSWEILHFSKSCSDINDKLEKNKKMFYVPSYFLGYQVEDCRVLFTYPYSKVHREKMGSTWVLLAPDGPHVGPMNLAIRVDAADADGRCRGTYCGHPGVLEVPPNIHHTRYCTEAIKTVITFVIPKFVLIHMTGNETRYSLKRNRKDIFMCIGLEVVHGIKSIHTHDP